jgi:hypothetical protein
MSESTPPPLARQIGGIAAELRAHAREESLRSGLAALAHALILTLLARILGRLESMVALWQAGQLPALAPQPARATARTRAPAAPARPWRWLAAFLPFPAIPAAEPRHAPHPRTRRPRQATRPAPRQAAPASPKRAAPIAAARPSRARPRPFPPPATAPQAHAAAPARPGFSKPVLAAAPSHA